ncbi:hypothetical protein [Pseudomonas baetica]|uniref:hypothetical protein n=1 Tax=Pseudomonas baetica TaxID=674054 RepID=UPI0012FD85CB|nr:hypothetical protein [Pseudomonas baetica]
MINSKMIHRFCLSISLVLFLSVSQAETVTPPLNFDFQSIQVSSALQLLADYRGLNLVLDDSIHGSLSMRMKDVTWMRQLNMYRLPRACYIA